MLRCSRLRNDAFRTGRFEVCGKTPEWLRESLSCPACGRLVPVPWPERRTAGRRVECIGGPTGRSGEAVEKDPVGDRVWKVFCSPVFCERSCDAKNPGSARKWLSSLKTWKKWNDRRIWRTFFRPREPRFWDLSQIGPQTLTDQGLTGPPYFRGFTPRPH